jgi:hypothetical protein
MKLKKINHPLYKIIYLLIYMINVHIMVTSCKKHKNIWKNILNNNSNCIIFYGDENQEENYILKDRILSIKCKDTYDCLPEKILLMIKFINTSDKFKNITHIFKVDDHDTIIDKNLEENIKNIKNIINIDFGGQRIHIINKKNKKFVKIDDLFFKRKKGGSKYHFPQTPKDSFWYNKKYNDKFCSYVLGGDGYILSKKSIQLITKYFENYTIEDIRKKHIFEDLMIGIILIKHNILPVKINKIIDTIKTTKKIDN